MITIPSSHKSCANPEPNAVALLNLDVTCNNVIGERAEQHNQVTFIQYPDGLVVSANEKICSNIKDT